jgi:chromosome segregation ATPase
MSTHIIKLTAAQLNSLDQLRVALSNKIHTAGFARATTEQDTLDALEALVELYHAGHQDTIDAREEEIVGLKDEIVGLKDERANYEGDAQALADYIATVHQHLTPEQYDKLQPKQPAILDDKLNDTIGW